jgi:arylsulfatase
VASLRAAVKDSNVVICVLDAARVDHFGAYGYPRPTTPNFDELAKDSVLFDQHFSNAPQTRSATASLLTSQYPDTHGLLANSGDQAEVPGLSPSAFTLEKALQGADFFTSLYSGNVIASPALGIGADFMSAEYQERASVTEPWDPVAFLTRDLEAPAPHRPRPEGRFFAYLHVLPPHQPYLAPKQTVDLFASTRPPTYWQGKFEFAEAVAGRASIATPDSWIAWGNLYDANLRWADAAVGSLVQTLRRTGTLEKTLLIVTADHGDAMREHGYGGHCGVPYDEALHIPLLIRFPGRSRPVGRVHALTQTIDVMPTVLDLLGVPYPRREVQGRSLVPLLTGQARAVNDFVFSRASLWDDSCYVIRDAHTTLLLFHGGTPRALYDMDADPWQTRNIVREQPASAQALASAFRRFALTQRYRPLDFLDAKYRPPRAEHLPTARVSAETRRQLKALGYVQ